MMLDLLHHRHPNALVSYFTRYLWHGMRAITINRVHSLTDCIQSRHGVGEALAVQRINVHRQVKHPQQTQRGAE